MIPRPPANEYNPLYQYYIDLVAEDELNTALAGSTAETVRFFSAITPEKADYRYAAGKWSVKEIFMHLVDVERAMTYKAFVSSRADHSILLHHINRNVYLENAPVARRNILSILDEFSAVRSATQALFRWMTAEQSALTGNHADNNHAISARAIGYSIAGHARHHMRIINERYLSANPIT